MELVKKRTRLAIAIWKFSTWKLNIFRDFIAITTHFSKKFLFFSLKTVVYTSIFWICVPFDFFVIINWPFCFHFHFQALNFNQIHSFSFFFYFVQEKVFHISNTKWHNNQKKNSNYKRYKFCFRFLNVFFFFA